MKSNEMNDLRSLRYWLWLWFDEESCEIFPLWFLWEETFSRWEIHEKRRRDSTDDQCKGYRTSLILTRLLPVQWTLNSLTLSLSSCGFFFLRPAADTLSLSHSFSPCLYPLVSVFSIWQMKRFLTGGQRETPVGNRTFLAAPFDKKIKCLPLCKQAIANFDLLFSSLLFFPPSAPLSPFPWPTYLYSYTSTHPYASI